MAGSIGPADEDEDRQELLFQERDGGEDHPTPRLRSEKGDMDVSDVSSMKEAQSTQNNALHDTPKVGMQFASFDEAYKFYEEYGKNKGFGIRIRTSVKSKTRISETTACKFVCLHEGIYKTKIKEGESSKARSTSTQKGGCKAQLRIVKDIDNDIWKITIFFDEHNHSLVTPRKRIFLKCNRRMPDAAKNLVEVFNKENLQINKVAAVLSGDTIGFKERDCWNYLRSVRYINLNVGDAQSVMTYFQKRQVENPQFFYAIQCDEKGRATNFFWVDAYSRMSYKQFGDVVTFDTTYRTNKYDMPFAPFTGVNHDYQSIQYGCALLQDETDATFVWLFETWLQAMGGHPPVSIITDQDLAMKAAISKVFHTTRHHLCLWHIMKKFGEKLSHVYSKGSHFKNELKSCIWETYKAEDFEERWNSLMLTFGLTDNEWLKHLYEIRESWVPTYNRLTFFAGMHTTSRSEGANAFFNGFVSWNSTLTDFVEKYEKALKKIRKNERTEDYESEQRYRILNEHNLILMHASRLYTRALFDKFKEQLNDIINFRVDEESTQGDYYTYVVKSKTGIPETFVVKLNLETFKGICECHHYEFMGIPCRHLLVVFNRRDVDEIPNHFILKRWTKGANKFKANESDLLNESEVQSKTLRLSHLCQEATQMSFLAHHSERGYKIAIEGIRQLVEKISLVETEEEGLHEPLLGYSKDSNDLGISSPSHYLLNPNVSQTKGRKKNDQKNTNTCRIKSSMELSQEKKRKCHLCNGQGHDKRTCPMNPTKKT